LKGLVKVPDGSLFYALTAVGTLFYEVTGGCSPLTCVARVAKVTCHWQHCW